MVELQGKSVFSGIAIGRISVLEKGDQLVKRHPVQETEEELADISEDALVYTSISGNFCDMLPLQYEIFDDNYN